MKPKFRKGDIIFWKASPEEKYQVVKIVTEDSGKLVKGDWGNDYKEFWVQPSSYVLKSLKTNKLSWDFFYVEDHYQLIQLAENKPLRWKNYEEILI